MIRCRQCGQLVEAAAYSAHIPCQKAREGHRRLQAGPDPLEPRKSPQRAHRLTGARARVLALLSDLQWHDGPQICAPGVGGSEGLRRLRELRQSGHQIEKRQISPGTWQYRLTETRSAG